MITAIYPIFRAARPLINSVFREYWYSRLKTDWSVSGDIENAEFQMLKSSVKINLNDIKFGDETYIVVDKSNFAKFVAQDDTPDLKYVTNRRDCNAFTDVLKGKIRAIGNFLVGDCWGYCTWVEGHHAFLIFYADQKWHALEPQTRKVYPLESVNEITFLKF